ncbi:MAG TPA: glycosyltransferase [Flavobacterium sp.]|nr:glycosyltransferase [Flavobacterium sp.]
MKFILNACSNFYPYAVGGTEVYVDNYCRYLENLGQQPVVICAVPDEAFSDHETVFEDDFLKVCKYYHNITIVYGLALKSTSTDSIYSKKGAPSSLSYLKFLKSQKILKQLSTLHIHSFTSTIGIDLFLQVISENPSMIVITSYHTPISCPKGTLMYKDTLQECRYKPSVKTCSDCILSSQKKIVLPLSKLINFLNLSHQKIPAIFKVKHLVKLELQSFEYLKSITQEWWCYSNGIKDILKINGIGNNSIKMARHGISEIFLKQTDIKKAKDKTIYMFSGRMVKIKGVITLLKAWLQLPVNVDKQLWLTAYPESDNPEISTLLKRISKREDIHFFGPKTQNELVKLYAMAHFVIIPSEWYEIGPLVLHEAISKHANVICSDIGGCKELANYYGSSAIVFKAGNFHQLAQKIKSSKYKKTDTLPKTFSRHFDIL